MNYFEFHIGDHTEATTHLTLVEDGALGRMLRKYYATERPLPADVKAVQRLVGARTKEEREAVETVLQEFFELQSDGWHQSRCDAEIAAFREKQAGKEGSKEGAKERQRRARERRKDLFEELRKLGQVPAYSTTTAELEAMLSRVTGASPSRAVTPPVTRDDTATQTPDSSTQTPDSVPDGTGVAAEPTTKAELWKAGKSLLSSAGMPDAQCGSFVGKLCKDYSDEVVVEAVRRAVVEQPADPASFLKATCQAAAGQRRGAKAVSSRHSGFDQKNYREGVNADGSFV
ncbi:MAG: YdaU family protein [Variovorax sp.]